MLTREQIDELFERSKDDRAIIVGSEVRMLCNMAIRALSAAPNNAGESPDARDAKRYRWLRDALDNEEVTTSLHDAFQQGSTMLDAAIDAAMGSPTDDEERKQ